MAFYAGFDLGGSHARILLANAQGVPLVRKTGEGISMKMVRADDAYACFYPLVESAVIAAGVDLTDCLGCCVAASGVDTPELAEKTASVFRQLGFPAEMLLVVNDCEVFLYSQKEPTIVLTVGTGSIAFGRSPARGTVRCGGWGRLLSDEGSGFDMGMRVLKLMGNFYDGRVDCPQLHCLFSKYCDLRRSADIDAFAIEHLLTKKAVASLAPLLIQAARDGDAAAKAELDTCIAQQVKLAVDLFSKLALPKDMPVTVLLWGGILTGCPEISSGVTAGIRAAIPLARVTSPETDALGAAVHAAQEMWRVPSGTHAE